MNKITPNQRTASGLAVLSLTTSLLALFFITGVSPLVMASPVVLILAFAPLAGMLGIILRNKEILIISSLMSLALTVLGIVSIGLFFAVPSLLLTISTFVYLRDKPVVEANEQAGISALIAALASLLVAIAAIIHEVPPHAGSILALAFGLIFYLFPLILTILGIAGIRSRNREFLFASSAIYLVLSIFLVLLLRKPLFLISSLLLVLSAFVYQGGVIGEFKKEVVDVRFKKIAMLLAGVSLIAAMGATLYSELVLVSGGCYTYQTSPTSGGRICGDFRTDYVIPVIISAVGIAGILRGNKLLLYASATVSFIRTIAYLQPIASLFLPSFITLIFSALVYKIGIRGGEYSAEAQGNANQYYIILFLSAIVILWIIAVYIFVQPSSVEMSGGYGYEHSP